MINENLKKYIEEVIFPQYKLNDMGHNIDHIKYVIDRSLKFAKGGKTCPACQKKVEEKACGGKAKKRYFGGWL